MVRDRPAPTLIFTWSNAESGIGMDVESSVTVGLANRLTRILSDAVAPPRFANVRRTNPASPGTRTLGNLN